MATKVSPAATGTAAIFSVSSHLVFQTDLLALDAADHDISSVLGDNLIVVEHLKLLASVLTHMGEEGLRTTGVLIEPVRDIHHNTLDGNPL